MDGHVKKMLYHQPPLAKPFIIEFVSMVIKDAIVRGASRRITILAKPAKYTDKWISYAIEAIVAINPFIRWQAR